ncbi:MAG TPA: VTT domain-containing protein [Patescibacteria group bacterium]|nr:VTT domain-containing protein [Patescibacteria group bacterium]
MGFEIGDLLHGDLRSVIEAIGLIGIFAIVFLESGMMVGFFFPGDSLLFTAGFLASQGFFNIWVLALGSFVFAVLGDSIGYAIGHKYGKRLFSKEDSLLFHKDHLKKAESFYEKHGGKTIILARFIPVIRAFAPVVAGIGSMKYPTFVAYNLVGAFFWAIGMSFLGYFLGNVIPDVDKYLLPIIAFIILASVAPAIYHIVKEKYAK